MLRARPAVLLATLALACSASDPPDGAEAPEERSAVDAGDPTVHVVFDQSLDQVSTPFDTAYEGMSLLSALLRRHGATVSLNSRPLAEFLPEIAGAGHVLVLGIPWQRRYDEAGLAAVRAFLASGGGVLVLTEHDGIYGHTEIQNALIEPYGIESLPAGAYGRRDASAPRGKIWPLARVDAWKLDRLLLYMPAPLRVSPPARALVELVDPDRPDHAVVGALNDELPGPLVVLGDLEMLWNMSPTSGVSAGRNSDFMLRLFGLLGGREGALAPREPEPRLAEAWRKGERLALFDASGLGWFPDGAPHGLGAFAERLSRAGYRIEVADGPESAYARADLVVSIVPIGTTAEEALLAAPKLLLVADGRSSLLRAEPEFVKAFYETMQGTRYVYPLNRIASHHGFGFLGVTLLARETSTMVARATLADGRAVLPLHRSAVIALGADADGVAARAFADRAYYASVNLTPVLYEDWRTNPSRRPLVIREGERVIHPRLPVVAASPRVMALADVELVTDEVLGTPAGEVVMEEILRWLAEEPPDAAPSPERDPAPDA